LSKVTDLLIHAKFTSQNYIPSDLREQKSFWWWTIYIKTFRKKINTNYI